MSFASPIALWALVLVPVAVAGYLWLERRRVRETSQFVAPGLLPNVVDHVPAWRRHLPAAILLLAVATFLLGFARPHAMLDETSEEATVVLALDTSHSMAARDVAPTRLAAAQASARRFLVGLPAKYRVGVVNFSTLAQLAAAPTTDRRFVDSALGALRIGQGTALGDGLATAVAVARGTPRGVKPPRGTKPPPSAILILSDGAQDGGQIKLADAINQARQAKIPVFTALLGTQSGIVAVPHIGGYVERIRVPPDPAALRQVAAGTGGRFFQAPTARQLALVYRDLRSRLGTTRKDEEVTVAFAGAGALLLLASGVLSMLWFRRIP
ncbi:MAG: Ca-activated chloride channel [Gaiellales bacterium]|nr:Ca-activated chloride channel [Gaiellales bacterium]